MLTQFGFIAHGRFGYWFQGELPSPKTARMLVKLHEDGLNESGEVIARLRSSWRLQSVRPAIENVSWAIWLQSIHQQTEGINLILESLNLAQIPVFTSEDDMFSEVANNWTGADV